MPVFVGTRRILRPVPSSAAASSVLTFLGSNVSTANASSYTFSSKDFGTAAANRRIIVGVFVYDNTPGGDVTTINSVSIGGTNGTLIDTTNSGSAVMTWAIRNVTTGTSGDIVVTPDATCLGCHVAWWAANISSDTQFFADHTSNSGSSVVANFETDWITSTGFALAMLTHQDTSDRALSIDNGFTEDVELFSEANSAFYSKISTGSDSSAITGTATSGTGTFYLSVASWAA